MTFLPSQVALVVPPLVGTMESAQREFAAALIVRACQAHGDAWRPISPQEVGAVISDDLEHKREPIVSLNRNPFFKPNFEKLADGKYGRWTGEPFKSPIELTELGIKSLERWVVDVDASVDTANDVPTHQPGEGTPREGGGT